MPNGAGSSATSTTGRSSGSPRCSSASAAPRERRRGQRAPRPGDRRARHGAAGPARAGERAPPAVLSERGLVPALEALALRTPVPVELAAVPDRRLPEQVEVSAYYVVAEALANVHKHAGARQVVVTATVDEAELLVEVVDDGAGGADPGERACGSRRPRRGPRGITRTRRPGGGGTRVAARLPLR